MDWLQRIAEIVGREKVAARIVILATDGPTPRAVGSSMYVWPSGKSGRIGRGVVETRVSEVARGLLDRLAAARNPASPQWLRERLRFPAGDVLGESSGGTIDVLVEAFGPAELTALDEARGCGEPLLLGRPLVEGPPAILLGEAAAIDVALWRGAARLLAEQPRRLLALTRTADGGEVVLERLARRQPQFYVYGTGLVARALVKVLAELPFDVIWLDTAPGNFPTEVPAGVAARTCRDLAGSVREAVPDALHAVMTAAHDMDLAVTRNILQAGRARYLGVIGSRLKRERLLARLADEGIPAETLSRIACPIGLPGIRSKAPAVIAVSIAAQALAVVQQDEDGG